MPFRSLRRVATPLLPAPPGPPAFGLPALVALALALAFTCSCRGDPARDQAATLVRLVSDLRDAPNPTKRGPLERLENMTCSFPDVCEAQQACVDAYKHHVRGIELLASMHAVDASAPDEEESTGLAMRLLEMNIEVEEGNKRMPLCEEKIADLRVAHKV